MAKRAIQPINNLTPDIPRAGLLTEAYQTFLAGRSPHTRRAYEFRLKAFMDWYRTQGDAAFVAHLRNYIAHLQDEGLSARSVQAHINTVKGFLKMAAALDPSGELAMALPTLDLAKPPSVRGERQGERLTVEERQYLINLPGNDSHKARRDTAMLALMAICGLRRAEVVSLNWGHIAELDGHKVIKNLEGKHGRIRTVKLPPGLWRLLQSYGKLAGLDMGFRAPVFVRIRKGDDIQPGERLTSSAVGWLVERYCRKAGLRGISPHDLRRTAAKLARGGGASIEQVQAMLGHASPQTTSAYIGDSLNLNDHAVDYSEVDLPGE